MPANTSATAKTYTFGLSAIGSTTVKAPPVLVTMAGKAAPTIQSFLGSPTSIASSGGVVTLSAQVTATKSCVFSATPTLKGLPATVSCTSGSGSKQVSVPANTSATAVTYTFGLSAIGSTTVKAPPVLVTVAGKAAPTIQSFSGSPTSIASSGGVVTLSAQVTATKSCVFSATPTLKGLPATVSCTSGSGSKQVSVPANTSATAKTYTFGLSAIGSTTVKAPPVLVTVAGVTGPVPVLDVSGTLTSDTTWSSAIATLYIMDGPVDVPADITLTVGPGTMIKSGGHSLTVEGALDAVGTAASPIVFTSINDNSVGGATGSGSPVAGDWGGISSNSAGTIDIEYADLDYATLAVDAFGTGGLTLANDRVSNGVLGAVLAEGPAAPVIEGNTFVDPSSEGPAGVGVIASGTPTVENNSMSGGPQTGAFAVRGDAINPALLAGNTVTGGAGTFELAGQVSTSGTLPALNVPWEIGYLETSGQEFSPSSCLDVLAGATLTLSPGAVVKGYGSGDCNGPVAESGLRVEGALDAVGTAASPIVFTSINDNSVGGATGSGSPVAGDWGGISSNSAGTIDIEYADLDYATLAVDAFGTGGLTLANDRVSNGVLGAVLAEGPAAPVIEGNTFVDPSSEGPAGVGVIASGTPTVENNSMSGGPQTGAFAVRGDAINPALLAGNTVTGGAGTFELAGQVSTSGTLPALNVPWEIGYLETSGQEFSPSSCLDVLAGATLTLSPGAVVKGYGSGDCNGPVAESGLRVEGALDAVGTAASPIVFTSINDNSVGGATGSGSPVAGDWGGISSELGWNDRHRVCRSGLRDPCGGCLRNRRVDPGQRPREQRGFGCGVSRGTGCSGDRGQHVRRSELRRPGRRWCDCEWHSHRGEQFDERRASDGCLRRPRGRDQPGLACRQHRHRRSRHLRAGRPGQHQWNPARAQCALGDRLLGDVRAGVLAQQLSRRAGGGHAHAQSGRGRQGLWIW